MAVCVNRGFILLGYWAMALVQRRWISLISVGWLPLCESPSRKLPRSSSAGYPEGLEIELLSEVLAQACRIAVMPRGFGDKAARMGIAGFGNATAAHGVAAGALGGYQSEVAHQMPRMGKALDVANFCDQANGADGVDTAQRAQGGHDRFKAPSAGALYQGLIQAAEAFVGCLRRQDVFGESLATIMRRIFVATLLLVLSTMTRDAWSQTASMNATSVELALLPTFCWAQFQVANAKGDEFIMHDCGPAANHYCGALIYVIRAKHSTNKAERLDLIRHADTDLAYTERGIQDYPRCSIREHVGGTRTEINSLLNLYGGRRKGPY
jgi:hypothetical protein